ncbi:MAG TPA: S-layer homology domain-containing protein, partial [Chloroflexia bacterium]
MPGTFLQGKIPGAGERPHPGSLPPPRPRQPHAPQDLSKNGWTNLFPNLHEVSAASATDAWAIGEQGRLVHYTGGAWTDVDPVVDPSNFAYDISMVSSTNGWIAAGWQAFQYDGSTWLARSEGLDELGLTIYDIATPSINDVWAVGGSPNNAKASIARWNGSSWSYTEPLLGSYAYFNDIAMASPTDGFIVGQDARVALVLHYDGTDWTEIPSPPDAGPLYAAWSGTPGELWASGETISSGYRIFRFSGGIWTSYPVPAGTAPGAIFMLSATEGYTVGYYSSSILRFDGTEWTLDYSGKPFRGIDGAGGQVWAVGHVDTIMNRTSTTPWTLQRGGPTADPLYSVAASSIDDAWAGSIDRGEGATFMHYTGGLWQPLPPNSELSGDVRDIQMLSKNEGYAVGGVYTSTGFIARWDGANWTRVGSPTASLYGLFMTGSGDGWAVGEGGSIWQAEGGTWHEASSPVTETLYSVAMDSISHGWAVGERLDPELCALVPTLLEYDGTQWVDKTGSLPWDSPLLYDIALDPGGTEGWAVGMAGTESFYNNTGLHYDGTSWHVDISADRYMRSVAVAAPGTAWAVGADYGAGAYHYIEGAWWYRTLPTAGFHSFNSVAMIPSVVGWAVGDGGLILRYDGPDASTPTLTPTPTTSASSSSTLTSTPSATTTAPARTPTFAATSTRTGSPVPTHTPIPTVQSGCGEFVDVPPDSAFYSFVRCLACKNVLGGYADGTFRPGNNVTRGQLSKIVANAADLTEPVAGQTFQDIPPDSTFYEFIERMFARGLISGYPCGQLAHEPCEPPANRPYFRPHANATRGQISKIIAIAGNFEDPVALQTFEDVTVGSTFHLWVENLASRGIMSGYDCGGPGEPCRPGSRKYFRPS